jgi:Lrp/AsnC family leucine-responsive transcriptional regulator
MEGVDKKILELLLTNAQLTNQELADNMALSPSHCFRRVKLLEEQGYIRKRTSHDKFTVIFVLQHRFLSAKPN